MSDPANHMIPPPSSPTNSSASSSDLDTESTGSFFHDRSTTLGTLMGVTFPAITFRAPSQHREANPPTSPPASSSSSSALTRKKKKKRKTIPAAADPRRRRWWRLCGDSDAKPASLGEFLEVERRVGEGAFFGGALEGVMAEHQPGNNGRILFADGRVLPPANVSEEEEEEEDDGEGASRAMALCRCPVSLTGICSGGG